MKYKELEAMTEKDLDKKLEEVQLELMKLNAQVATGTTPKSPGQIRQLKKTIARIMMVKTQKQK
ncbi:MAG: 50S ribosomal protein L29 [archaeon]